MFVRIAQVAGPLLACSYLAAQVSLTPLVTIDVSSTANAGNPEFIGNNPSAVAWNGTDLFLAGFNNQPVGSPGNVAIVRISAALSGTPAFGASFGTLTAPGLRGYTGLDIDGSTLVASYDPGSTANEGISAWDLNGNPLWQRSARGGSGVGFDPGFGGVDAGVAWTTFGSGRRALQDSATGADIYTSGNGMIINPSGGTFWRDMDFDDVTGDFYGRKGNLVITGERTGGNSLGNLRELASPTLAEFVAAQNIAVLRTGPHVAVIWNDRPITAGTQRFFDVIRVTRADGTLDRPEWNGFTAMDSSGAYDFSFDAASQTLAIMDFSLRQVHLFAVDVQPFYPYGDGCSDSTGNAPRLAFAGDPTPVTGGLTLTVEGAPGSLGFVAFGFQRASLPLNYNSCAILISPVIDFWFGPLPMGPAGLATQAWTLPAGTNGYAITSQAATIDPASPFPFVVSNGIQLFVP